ncbi:MAG: PepSY domain-containing protein [Burkholderiaceae bacterium]|nr:PepSY domain-containing protein [Burkholderiaceae bacterium]MBP7661869.1 PepSY domain-containing protein [Burkholderiaceae bacterium]
MRLRKQARRVWLTLHQGIGLGLGLLFVLLGLTGSLLVFYLEIQGLFDPGRPASHEQVASASPDAVLARLRTLYPERAGPWRIEMPRDLGGPLRARYYNPPERAGRLFAPCLITLDPSSLQVRRSGFWGDDPLTWIYNLHYSLLLEHNGRMVVGGAGLFMVFSLVSGAVLWWPSRSRMASSLMPRLRPGHVRRIYDLHVLGGLYGWLLLAAVGLTGAALAFPDVVRGLLAAASPMHGHPAAAAPGNAPPSVTLAEAVRVARSRFPDAQVRWIHSSGAGGEPISIRLHQAGEPSHRFPHTQVWLRPDDATVVAVKDASRASPGDTVLAWLHPLHNGEALGLPGRLLVCAAGLIPALLFVTGWIRWRQKARSRGVSRS